MTEDQRRYALEYVRRLRDYIPDVQYEEIGNTFHLNRPQRTRFGTVRYNIGDSHGNALKYTVYAYPQFDDPERRFINNSRYASNPSSKQWHYVFSPSDEDAVVYALGVHESACNSREPR